MNITNSNFTKTLPEVEAAINSAAFIAIDGEFTGLNAGQNWNAMDIPEERYQKINEGALDFLMVQFGLCAFKQDQDGKFLQKTFNFYVFPRPLRKGAPDPKFMCQASSIDFLVSQGFDFTKLFREGISYLKPQDKKKLMDHVVDRHSQRDAQKTDGKIKRERIPIPEEHKEFIQGICAKVEDFMKTEEKELELEKCNAFLRLLLYQEIGSKFPETYLETKMDGRKDRYIVVIRGQEEDLAKIEEDRRKQELQEVEDAEGFYKVFKLLSESGKPIVGHNMMLDLCHIIHQFHTPLPDIYSDFKILVHSLFPRVLDTKLLANSHPFKDKIPDSTLDKLLACLCKGPFALPDVEAEDESCCYTIGEKLHEAGYDAYVTGLAFITMANYLGGLKEPPVNQVPPTSTILAPFMNKLYLQCSHDISYINLAGTEEIPSREHIFHVTFPETWKRTELLDLFSPFGRVFVAWINDTSAWVALIERHYAAVVTSKISHGNSVTVLPYSEVKSNESAGGGGVKRPSSADTEAPAFKRQRSNSLKRNSATFEAIPEEEEVENGVATPAGS